MIHHAHNRLLHILFPACPLRSLRFSLIDILFYSRRVGGSLAHTIFGFARRALQVREASLHCRFSLSPNKSRFFFFPTIGIRHGIVLGRGKAKGTRRWTMFPQIVTTIKGFLKGWRIFSTQPPPADSVGRFRRCEPLSLPLEIHGMSTLEGKVFEWFEIGP